MVEGQAFASIPDFLDRFPQIVTDPLLLIVEEHDRGFVTRDPHRDGDGHPSPEAARIRAWF
jgi:hypothetical protein